MGTVIQQLIEGSLALCSVMKMGRKRNGNLEAVVQQSQTVREKSSVYSQLLSGKGRRRGSPALSACASTDY